MAIQLHTSSIRHYINSWPSHRLWPFWQTFIQYLRQMLYDNSRRLLLMTPGSIHHGLAYALQLSFLNLSWLSELQLNILTCLYFLYYNFWTVMERLHILHAHSTKGILHVHATNDTLQVRPMTLCATFMPKIAFSDFVAVARCMFNTFCSFQGPMTKWKIKF